MGPGVVPDLTDIGQFSLRLPGFDVLDQQWGVSAGDGFPFRRQQVPAEIPPLPVPIKFLPERDALSLLIFIRGKIRPW